MTVARDDEVRHPRRRRLLRRQRVGADSTGTTFQNAQQRVVRRRSNLQQALTVSSDAYFYTVGDDFWNVWKRRRHGTRARHPDGGARARLRRSRPASSSTRPTGRVPDPAWVKAFANANYKTEDGASSRTAPGTRPTTSSPPSARATSSSRRCSSPTRTPRSRTAARCGSRTSTSKVVDPNGDVVTAVGAAGRSGTSTFDPTTRAAMLAGLRRARSPGQPAGHRVRRVPGLPARRRSRSRARPAPRRSPGKGDTSLFVGDVPGRRTRSTSCRGRRGAGRLRRADRGADRAAGHRGDERPAARRRSPIDQTGHD